MTIAKTLLSKKSHDKLIKAGKDLLLGKPIEMIAKEYCVKLDTLTSYLLYRLNIIDKKLWVKVCQKLEIHEPKRHDRGKMYKGCLQAYAGGCEGNLGLSKCKNCEMIKGGK